MAASLHEALQQLCHAAPDAACVSQGDRQLTRAQFLRRIDDAAAGLQGQGVVDRALVAWLGHNSIAMLATLFACSRLGAVFMPLNWRLTEAELSAIVGHAGASHLIGTPELAALRDELMSNVGVERTPVRGIEDGDALLVYTSGTTGRPKGALHTQAGMLANVAAALDAQGIDEATRTLAVLPLFHVGGLCIQTLPTLLAGGAVRLQPRFDASAWFDDVKSWRPSTSLLVPAVMRALIDHPRWRDADLSSLRFVNSGSQIVPVALIEAFHARGVPVAQVYGATETGPVSVALHPRDALAHVGCAGRPALTVELRLADDGEVCLRAPNLLRAYHRDAQPAFDADGWFHTRDLAERGADGMLRMLGRCTDLIISGGENIHPAEIEDLVAAHAAVAECAVVGMPDTRWGEVPVLALVLREGAREAEVVSALRAAFEQGLARFKHPQRIVVLDALPRTALGKLRQDALKLALLPALVSGAALQ